MDELRQKIAKMLADGPWHGGPDYDEALEVADRILAIPEIAELLKLKLVKPIDADS